MILEGVHYEVDWRDFKKGRSLFFPCLDPERARQTLHATTDRLGMRILTKVTIEDKIMGLRVWRM